MNPILAEFMISGDYLVVVAGALIPVIGGVWIKARRNGIRAATNNITLQAPVPTVPISKVYTPPTYWQHMEVVRRVDKLETGQEEIRKELGESFRKLIEVGEERKDKLMDKIDASAKGFHERVNQIVNEFHHAPKK